MDRKFLMTAFGYAIVGVVLGIFMAVAKNHSQLATHTHILLVGFVMSLAYALCHKLWLPPVPSKLAKIHYYVHQLGSALLFIGLFLMYGGFAAEAAVGPVLGIGSIAVLAGVIMMKFELIRSTKKPTVPR